MAHSTRQQGQSSVETLALLPVLAVVVVAALWLVAAASGWLATAAATWQVARHEAVRTAPRATVTAGGVVVSVAPPRQGVVEARGRATLAPLIGSSAIPVAPEAAVALP